MNDEKYYVNLEKAGPDGSRSSVFYQSEGWQMDRLDNGVLVLFNENGRRLIEYSPYAWQSVETVNINTQENTDG